MVRDSHAVCLGVLRLDDTGAAGTDSASVRGLAVNDSFVVDATQVTLGTETVSYDGDLEQLEVRGEGGDDAFAVSPSAATILTLDGGAD